MAFLVILGVSNAGALGRKARTALARMEAPVRPLAEWVLANSEGPYRWLRSDLNVQPSAAIVLLVGSTYGLLGGAFYSGLAADVYWLYQRASCKTPEASRSRRRSRIGE